MSAERLGPMLLAFCSVAVAALAVGPYLYRSLVPGAASGPTGGCSFVVVSGGLVALLAGAAVWLLRRRRRDNEPELDRRLWEAMLEARGSGKPEGDDPG